MFDNWSWIILKNVKSTLSFLSNKYVSFNFKNSKFSLFSTPRPRRFGLNINPLILADAGTRRNFSASLEGSGYLVSFSFQNSNGSSICLFEIPSLYCLINIS